MPRPRLITDEAMIAAARRCAIERGPSVSLDTIAEALGVTAPALLRRYGSREALLVAALRPPAEPEWLADLERDPDDRPLAEQLEGMFARILTFFEREAPAMSARRESGIPLERFMKDSPPSTRGITALSSWLERARDRGLVEGDSFETPALAILTTLAGRTFLEHCLQRPLWRRSREHFLKDLAALHARALGARAPRRAAAASATPRRSRRAE